MTNGDGTMNNGGANRDGATGDGTPNDDDLGIEANEELRTGDASMNADRGDGDTD